MLEERSNRRTFPIDRHAGAIIAGVVADGRVVINRAQEEASNYKSFYGDPIPGHVLAERIASFMHAFNLYWYVRPFGICTLVAAYDIEGPQLYLVDPAGTMHKYYGMAVGKGRQGAKNEIEKLKLSELTCREAVSAIAKMYVLHNTCVWLFIHALPFAAHSLLSAIIISETTCLSMCSLHQVHDEEKSFEIEMAWVCDESKKQFQRVPQDIVAEADKAAKEALEAEDM